ncbi:SUN domain-containing protein 2 isoform X3 [Apteryx mantelli]|uniref:SUN domain-containing protein 2 isoform X3 n=1 Tax=Apteryx mantelli TaxID=2696672 RepID=A0ABM4FMD4_9AVES
MSRRSQRLVTARYYQGDDDAAASSSSSSLLGGQQAPFKESASRTVRRKSSSMKRLSPGPSTQTTYYSESMMSESYLGGNRGLSALGSSGFDDGLDSSSYWGGELSMRRRRGTGDTESSKINGLVESKTYDTYASSSGYSSEDDYAGHFCSGQSSSGSGLRSAASRVGSFLWHVVTSPVRFLGWLLSWVRAAWHRFTGMVPLLDGVTSRSPKEGHRWEKAAAVIQAPLSSRISRRYSGLKKFLLLLLLLLLLAAVAYGAWYFYPYGLSTLSFPAFLWGSAEVSSSASGGADVPAARDLTAFDQGQSREHQLLARFQALEKRFKVLEAEASRWELQRGAVAAGGELKQGDVLTLLEGLVSHREEELKEHVRNDMAAHVQDELGALRAQLQMDLNGRLGKITQASQEMEARLFELNSEWQSSTQEGLRGSFQQEMDKLERELAGLKRELALLKSDQEVMGKHMEVMLEQIKGVRTDQVHLIVNQALKRYSEDRVGMVDYALESAGASVINTRCSETYETKTALLSLFGIPLWYHSQSPRVILQPDVNPGNCWAFRGSQGFAVIRLSSPIRPTAVTLEHIPKALSPQGTIPSAPKDFTVYGLKEEGEEEGALLGQFTYNHDGDPIQTFYFKGEDTFQLVELRILSNWGHPEYTCIYRFRVHGEPAH